MKVKLDSEEYWPILVLDEEFGQEYEVSQELLDRYMKAKADFEKVWKELLEVTNGQ